MNAFVDVKKAGLWVIDVQEKLFPLIAHSEDIVRTLRFVIKAAKILQIPLFITEQYPSGLGETIEEVKQEFQPNQKVFTKTTFSGMGDPIIKQAVEKMAIDQWILVGIEAHICVLQTAKDLLNLGKQVIVLQDGVGSTNSQKYLSALQELRACGARVSHSESIFYECMKDAKIPQFKDVQQVLKEAFFSW